MPTNLNKTTILKTLTTIKKQFPIKEFVVFGSYAKDTNSSKSDLDVAYILKDGDKLSFDNFLRLEEELSKELNIKVDLMNFKKLNPLIKLDASKDFIYV